MRLVRKTLDSVGLKNWPITRKIVVAVIGGTIVLFGVALIFLPGPGSVVIPLGLLILASEFAWARLMLRRGKKVVSKAREKFTQPEHSVRGP